MGHDRTDHGSAATTTEQEVSVLAAERYGLHFDIQRSIRYHQRRRAWFDGWHKLTVGAAAVFGSATFYSVLQQYSELAMLLAGLVTLLSVADFVIGNGTMARLHHDLARDFIRLDVRLRLADNADRGLLRELWEERLAIEAREPPTKVILNRICYNEQLRAEGRDGEEHYIQLGWLQRAVAHLIDIGAHRRAKKPPTTPPADTPADTAGSAG